MKIRGNKLRRIIRRVLVETQEPIKIVIEHEEIANVIKNYQNDFITRFSGVYMTDDQEITVEYGSPEARKYVDRKDCQQMGTDLEDLLSDWCWINQVRAVRGRDVIEVGISINKSPTDENGYLIHDGPRSVSYTKEDYDKLAKYL